MAFYTAQTHVSLLTRHLDGPLDPHGLERLAVQFSMLVGQEENPLSNPSMAQLQGYLMQFKTEPQAAVHLANFTTFFEVGSNGRSTSRTPTG